MGKIKATNPVVELDNYETLINFANSLEQVCIETVESGKMTNDQALIIHGRNLKEEDCLTTEGFLNALDTNLRNKLMAN